MSEQPPADTKTAKKTTPIVPPAPVGITLEGPYVVLPLDAYNELLGNHLAILKGDYIKLTEVEDRVARSVNAALAAMSRTLEREVSSATRQNPSGGS